jgi:16S rRNA (adenine1518-N6/adenine1519-N6)-dimethyltransferase
MGGYRAKKRLGQHFLQSQAIIDKIVELVEARPVDRIVEIGPGQGALTAALAQSGASVTAVEFDRDLSAYLEKLRDEYPNVEIVQGDFLSFDPEGSEIKLVGNIPYNITSPVVDWIVAHRDHLSRVYLMVQRELADRLASSPGSKDWSPIAIFTQLHFDIRRCFDVAPEHFKPPPKVMSSVIEFVGRESVVVEHYDRFEKLVRASFAHRRKTMVNNLSSELMLSKESLRDILARGDLDENVRAEQVTIAQFLELTKLLLAHNIF